MGAPWDFQGVLALTAAPLAPSLRGLLRPPPSHRASEEAGPLLLGCPLLTAPGSRGTVGRPPGQALGSRIAAVQRDWWCWRLKQGCCGTTHSSPTVRSMRGSAGRGCSGRRRQKGFRADQAGSAPGPPAKPTSLNHTLLLCQRSSWSLPMGERGWSVLQAPLHTHLTVSPALCWAVSCRSRTDRALCPPGSGFCWVPEAAEENQEWEGRSGPHPWLLLLGQGWQGLFLSPVIPAPSGAPWP